MKLYPKMTMGEMALNHETRVESQFRIPIYRGPKPKRNLYTFS